MFTDEFGNLFIRDDAGTFGINSDIHRVGNADGISDLNLALLGKSCGNDVLSHVGVHNDLTAG